MSKARATHAAVGGPGAFASIEQLRCWDRLSARSRAHLEGISEVCDAWKTLWREREEVDAIWALAATLPVRQAVWWATLAAWHGVKGELTTAEDQTFASVLAWLRHSEEEQAAQVGRRARALGPGHAIGCAAQAAVLDDRLDAAEAAATAVFLAQHRAQENYAVFLALGRSVADGSLHWK